MEPSRAGRAVRVAALVLGVALPAALIALVRALPAASLPAAGLDWVTDVLAVGLAGVATAAALSMLVTALQTGSLSSALLAGSSAAMAGAAVGLLADARLEVPVAGAALLLLGASAVDRGSMLVAGRRERIGSVGATLVVAEGLVAAELLPALSQLADPARPAIAFAGAGLAVVAALVVLGRPIALVPVGVAIALAGLAVARPGGLEGPVALTLLIASQLVAVGLRPMRILHADVAPIDRLPDLAARVSDAVLRFDGRLQLRDWNDRAAALLGLDPASAGARIEDLIGIRLAELPGDDGVVHLGARVGGIDVVLLRSGGGLTAVIRDPEETPETERLGRELRGTIEELLQARRTIELQRQEIERSSATDSLTGVSSRGALLERLSTEIAQARRYAHPVAVVILDVDGFSEHNRTLGTEAGNAILQELTLRVRLRVREADALGRAGSDSFLVILPHTDEAGAATFADALQRRVGLRPLTIGGQPVSVTTSVGVAVMRPGEDLDLDGLLSRVEEALASAKSAGGNRIALDRLHGLARLEERRPPSMTVVPPTDDNAETGA